MTNLTYSQQTALDNFLIYEQEVTIGHCAVCLTLLYEEQSNWMFIDGSFNDLPCKKWNFAPVVNSRGKVLFCEKHKDDPFGEHYFLLPYPGLPLTEQLNYMESSVISPLKIMTIISRQQSSSNTYIGFHQLRGSMWTTPNRDFASILYSGSLGLHINQQQSDRVNICGKFRLFSLK